MGGGRYRAKSPQVSIYHSFEVDSAWPDRYPANVADFEPTNTSDLYEATRRHDQHYSGSSVAFLFEFKTDFGLES